MTPGSAVPPAALEVEGVAFAYPDGHQALFGVSFRIGRGERVALLGPNGAGKTTLVLQCNGVLLPGAGRVAVAGLPVAPEHLKEIRRRVGIVFQDPDDQLFMPTVAEDVAFGPANLGLRGAELETRVKAALAAVGMEEHAVALEHQGRLAGPVGPEQGDPLPRLDAEADPEQRLMAVRVGEGQALDLQGRGRRRSHGRIAQAVAATRAAAAGRQRAASHWPRVAASSWSTGIDPA